MEDVCIYGNPTLDYIVLEDGSRKIGYGGGVYYSSLPFQREGRYRLNVYAVYSPKIHNHPVYKAVNKLQYSSTATIFKLVYRGSSRTLYLEERAPPLYPWNIHEGLCISIVNPVFHEVTEANLAMIKVRSQLLAGDMQGFVRSLDNGRVVYSCSTRALHLLRYFDVVHMDVDELKAATCVWDELRALERLLNMVRGTRVVVTGRLKPIHVVDHGSLKSINIDDSPLVSDKTGAGDYFLGTLLVNMLSHEDFTKAVEKAHDETTKWLIERNASSPPTTL